MVVSGGGLRISSSTTSGCSRDFSADDVKSSAVDDLDDLGEKSYRCLLSSSSSDLLLLFFDWLDDDVDTSASSRCRADSIAASFPSLSSPSPLLSRDDPSSRGSMSYKEVAYLGPRCADVDDNGVDGANASTMTRPFDDAATASTAADARPIRRRWLRMVKLMFSG